MVGLLEAVAAPESLKAPGEATGYEMMCISRAWPGLGAEERRGVPPAGLRASQPKERLPPLRVRTREGVLEAAVAESYRRRNTGRP